MRGDEVYGMKIESVNLERNQISVPAVGSQRWRRNKRVFDSGNPSTVDESVDSVWRRPGSASPADDVSLQRSTLHVTADRGGVEACRTDALQRGSSSVMIWPLQSCTGFQRGHTKLLLFTKVPRMPCILPCVA